VRRGEIWLVTETDAVVLVGADTIHDYGFPVTWALPVRHEQPVGVDAPLVVPLSPTDAGLRIRTWVEVYGITALRTDGLRDDVAGDRQRPWPRRIGVLTPDAVTRIDRSLGLLLGLTQST
jgi:mRNA-degrading endonuclease toxin of MazEF toxin-antitoxin module